MWVCQHWTLLLLYIIINSSIPEVATCVSSADTRYSTSYCSSLIDTYMHLLCSYFRLKTHKSLAGTLSKHSKPERQPSPTVRGAGYSTTCLFLSAIVVNTDPHWLYVNNPLKQVTHYASNCSKKSSGKGCPRNSDLFLFYCSNAWNLEKKIMFFPYQ